MLYHEFLARIEGSNEQIDSNRMVSPLITNYPHIIENVGKCPDPSSIPELCKNRVTCNKSCPPQRATLRAAKATATNSCSRMKCDLCLAAITEDKEDALQCEGTCQLWFHRYCVGVSQSLFRTLASTDDKPYVCLNCSHEHHQATVNELWSEVAALRAEIAELRTALDAFRSSSDNSNAIASLMEEVQQLKAQPPRETTPLPR